jgi:hypothetical protein
MFTITMLLLRAELRTKVFPMERGVPDARDAVDLGVSGRAPGSVIQGHQQVVFLFQKSKKFRGLPSLQPTCCDTLSARSQAV